MTQARFDGVKPRSLWIEGRATLTMVPSRMTIKIPAQRTYSAGHRRSRPGGETCSAENLTPETTSAPRPVKPAWGGFRCRVEVPVPAPRGAIEHPARTAGHLGVLHVGLLHVVLRTL